MSCSRTQHGDACGDRKPRTETDALPLSESDFNIDDSKSMFSYGEDVIWKTRYVIFVGYFGNTSGL